MATKKKRTNSAKSNYIPIKKVPPEEYSIDINDENLLNGEMLMPKDSEKFVRKHRASKKIIGIEQITPAARAVLLKGIQSGLWRYDAAALIGIPRNNFMSWLRKAKEPDAEQIYVDFFNDIQLAEAKLKDTLLFLVMHQIKHAKDEKNRFAALKFYMEKRFPRQFSNLNTQFISKSDKDIINTTGVIILPSKDEDEE